MKYISISGSMAAGKSTLLHRLQGRWGDQMKYHEERPQDNPFINEYYADSTRWSFHSQIAFLSLYFDDLRYENRNWLKADKPYYLFDRSLEENMVFARYRLEAGDVTETEYQIIDKMAHGIETLMPPIDKYIYLRCSPETMMNRLQERGRVYESELEIAFAKHQLALYEQWSNQLPEDRTLFVNVDHEYDLEEIVRFIQAD